jgi:hypothetical protein
MPKEVDGLLDEFRRVDLPRNRAGVRHAMKLPAVAALAQPPRESATSGSQDT